VESYRSRGRGRSTNDRSRGGTQEWRVKTQSTNDAGPHALQYVSDAEGLNPHSVPESDAETMASNLHSIPGDSVVCSDSDMEGRAERKRANAQPSWLFTAITAVAARAPYIMKNQKLATLDFSSAIGGLGPL
jgi:hypothetical protein